MSKLLINGEWREGSGSETLCDKFSGAPFGEMALASPQDVEAAVTGVSGGFETVAPYDRFRILSKAAELILARQELLVRLMTSEVGFTRADGENEVRRCAQTIQLSAEEAKRITGELVPMDATPGLQNRMGFTIRVPRGVVCAITPYNSPLNTVAHKIAPALAAGNSVVLKPSEHTPLTAVELCKALLDAGLPPRLLALVHGPGAEIGRQLVADQRIAFYTFTGSTRVGKEIQRGAGLRGTQMELGSIASTIICHDADVAAAMPKIINASFRKAGQVCTSVQRMLVDRRIAEAFVERFVGATRALKFGDPSDPAVTVGPMISAAQAQRAKSWVEEAIAQGAELVTGGSLHGNVMEPTVLRNVKPAMRVVCEEIFAPVVSIIEYDGLQDAFDMANATPFGLAVGVYTANLVTAFAAARSLRFGGIHINEASSSRVDVMPFGGVKDSGFGREGPRYAVREMTEERLVTIAY